VSSTHTWRSTRSPCTMKRRPRSRSSLLTLRSFHTSSLIMIIHHMLHLHKGQAMTMPMIIHQHGAYIGDEIDLHLGQKPKLGGGTPTIHSSTYHILLVLCISMFRFLFFIVLVLISTFQNTKRPKLFLLFIFVCLFSF
jgi:hypothetical protein